MDRPKGMQVLVAESDPAVLTILAGLLADWGFTTKVCHSGDEVWKALQSPDGPRLAIVDWSIRGLEAVEVCRRVRATNGMHYVYIALLTGCVNQSDLVMALEAG